MRASGSDNQRIRLQKFLADAGVASRRASEELIRSGRVTVDGATIRAMGYKIDPIKSHVQLDNQTITLKKFNTYLAFNKPRGVLSTMSDPKGRSSIGDFLDNLGARLFHVGRLDKESEGLILLTDDGQWANQIAHPSKGVSKRYRVWCQERVSPEVIKELTRGVQLEDGLARAISSKAVPGGFEIEIHEGRNQIVRRMAESVNLTVIRLQRIEIGRIKLGELPVGKWRNLSDVELINTFKD